MTAGHQLQERPEFVWLLPSPECPYCEIPWHLLTVTLRVGSARVWGTEVRSVLCVCVSDAASRGESGAASEPDARGAGGKRDASRSAGSDPDLSEGVKAYG